MATRTERESEMEREDFLQVLRYEPDTGKFYWKVDLRCGANGRLFRQAGDEAGGLTDSGYIVISARYRKFYAHRLAWFLTYGEWPAGKLDHRDLDRRNNRISNLRMATNGQNMANTKVRARTGFKGVIVPKLSPNSFVAQISIDGRPKYLGTFRTAEEAHAAYAAAAVARHGEFARLD